MTSSLVRGQPNNIDSANMIFLPYIKIGIIFQPFRPAFPENLCVSNIGPFCYLLTIAFEEIMAVDKTHQ